MNSTKKIYANDFREQPLWFRGINRVWRLTSPLGTRSVLNKDGLVKAAMKSTGHNDFGPGNWEEALDRMLDSIRHEARLHPIGEFITRQRILQLLSVRLRAEHWFKKHPEILEQELYPVLLIIGLQRTGTTKLQRLLAADPDNRALLSWEALNPAPLKKDRSDSLKRIRVARTSEKALKYMSPGFFAIHPVEHQAPEEDVLLLDASFMSTTAEATMHVPSYANWLENTDQSDAYAYMARLMKLLQWQRPAKRWILKTPHHLEFLDLAKTHFGDVQFIWTHRNVQECIPSFLSMVSYARILFSNEVSQQEVAAHWVRKIGYMLEQAQACYHENQQQLFSHVLYEKLLQDPLEVVDELYRQRGEPIRPGLRETFRLANEQNPQGKYGWHNYRLEDFGLDPQAIDRATAEYNKFSAALGMEPMKSTA